MKVKTTLKAGGRFVQHNEMQVRKPAQGFKVKTQLKAGAVTFNHNQTQAQSRKRSTADPINPRR